MIGGIGPESTIEYNRGVIAAYRERHKDGDSPSILINSISVKKLLEMVSSNQLAAVAECLANEVEKLARGGADFALFAWNTPHIVFNQVQRRSSIPLVSIVEATCDATKALGLKRADVFGTRFTIRARFYLDAFAEEGIAVIAPAPDEQAYNP